jgi:glyoxylase-like metal-dependent hydrolase (beta-lactamase superfamily II)
VHLVTDWWERVRLLEDEDELAPGLRAWHSGVHHRGSMVVEVDTSVGVVAISDSFFVYENIEAGRALGLNESFEEMFRTNARVRRTAQHVIPLYDHRVFDRYPGGVIAPIDEEASA